jgi:predicted dehydrogenase
MRYVVNFAKATADFDFGREEPLVLSQDGRSEPVPLSPLTGYDEEISHLVDTIAHGRRDLIATIEDAAAVARLLEAERQSLDTGLASPIQP